jgi:hypothetical protein
MNLGKDFGIFGNKIKLQEIYFFGKNYILCGANVVEIKKWLEKERVFVWIISYY